MRQFFEAKKEESKSLLSKTYDKTSTVADLYQAFTPGLLASKMGVRGDLIQRPLSRVFLGDFFEFTSIRHHLPRLENLDQPDFSSTINDDNVFCRPVSDVGVHREEKFYTIAKEDNNIKADWMFWVRLVMLPITAYILRSY